MSTLAFIEHKTQADFVVRWIKGNPAQAQNVVLVVFDSDSETIFKKNQIAYYLEDDFIKYETYRGVSDRAYHMAANWWKRDSLKEFNFI